MHRIALIGAGRIGRIHAANIAANPRLQLAWVADDVPDAASALARLHGSRTAAPGDAIADPETDGVVVASPTATHVSYTLMAARHGKAVLCEKPLDLDLASATSAATQLDALQGRVVLAFNRRFDPHFAALRRKIVNRSVGQVETLHIISHDPAPPPLDYLAGSGGIFKDMVIHDFDMARWLLDEEPTGVFASASCLVDERIAAVPDADTAKTILRTASGRLCMISSSRRSGYGYDQRIEVFGSGGMIRAANVAETCLETWTEAGAAADPFQNFFLDRYRDAYRAEMEHFADVLDGGEPMVTHRDGVAALALAEAAARSVRTGRMEAL